MKIYFVSPWRILRFAAIGLVAGLWLAYGAAGLPTEHRLVPAIVVVTVLLFVALVFQAIIITKNGIVYVRTGYQDIAVEKTAYGNIKSISLESQDGSRTKVVLWPTRSQHDVGIVGDKMLSLEIELENKKRKKRIPLRLFGSRERVIIVQTLLERIVARLQQ